MGWQSAWELYQDEHPDADWYDFEADYWGDGSEEDSEDNEDSSEPTPEFVRQTVWNDDLKCYQALPYTPIANKGFEYIQKYGAEEDKEEADYYASIEAEQQKQDEYAFEEGDVEES